MALSPSTHANFSWRFNRGTLLRDLRSRLYQFAHTPARMSLAGMIFSARFVSCNEKSSLSAVVHVIVMKELARLICIGCSCFHRPTLLNHLRNDWVLISNPFHQRAFPTLGEHGENSKKAIEKLQGECRTSQFHLSELTDEKSALLVNLPKEVISCYRGNGADQLSARFRHFIEKRGMICHLSQRRIERLQQLALIDTDPSQPYELAAILEHLKLKGGCPMTQKSPSYLYLPFASPPRHIDLLNGTSAFTPEVGHRMMGLFYLGFVKTKGPARKFKEPCLYFKFARSKAIKALSIATQTVGLAMHVANRIILLTIALATSIPFGIIFYQKDSDPNTSACEAIYEAQQRVENAKLFLMKTARLLLIVVQKLKLAESAAFVKNLLIQNEHFFSLRKALSFTICIIIAQLAQMAWARLYRFAETKRPSDQSLKASKEIEELQVRLKDLKRRQAELLQMPSLNGDVKIQIVAWHLHNILALRSDECAALSHTEKSHLFTCGIHHTLIKERTLTAVLDTNLQAPFHGETIYHYITRVKRECPTTRKEPKALLFPFAQPPKVQGLTEEIDAIDYGDELKQSRNSLLKRAYEERVSKAKI